MQLQTILGLVFLGVAHVAAIEHCGNSNDVAVADALLPARADLAKRQNTTTPTAVDVYFHVASTPANSNRLTDEIVAAQFTVLHDTYLLYGFELKLVNTSRIVDEVIGRGFYGNDSTLTGAAYDAYVAYRAATRRGGYDALNLYFHSDLLESLWGQCDLPSIVSSKPGSSGFFTDGCTINGDNMPGLMTKDGTDPNPRRGHVAIQ